MSARDYQGNAEDDVDNALERRHRLDRLTLGLVLARGDYQNRDICYEYDKQRYADDPAHHADIIRHLHGGEVDFPEQGYRQRAEEKDSHRKRERIIPFADDRVDRYRTDDRAHTEHHQEVEQVGADDVAKGDLVRAIERSRGTYGELGGAGAEGDYRKTDDDRRYL